ncbi:hypothetical protein [Nonomuraea jabiensis]|uniref:hypothetical protein n=1 Tax=Nonomuraea jabiensis TaxID=882448 RepID=UPI003D70D607
MTMRNDPPLPPAPERRSELEPLVRYVPHLPARRIRDRLAAVARPRGGLLLLGVPVGAVCALVGLEEAFAGDPPGADPFTDLTPLAIGVRALYGLAGWCWLVAILGALDRPRPERPPRRSGAYLAAAVLPLYVLHQPIVVAVAYFVVGMREPTAG